MIKMRLAGMGYVYCDDGGYFYAVPQRVAPHYAAARLAETLLLRITYHFLIFAWITSVSPVLMMISLLLLLGFFQAAILLFRFLYMGFWPRFTSLYQYSAQCHYRLIILPVLPPDKQWPADDELRRCIDLGASIITLVAFRDDGASDGRV